MADPIADLHGPIKIAATQYLTIESLLAADKFAGIPQATATLKDAVASDPTRALDKDFDAPTINVMSQATDLHSARLAFKALSDSMIAALVHNQIKTGQLHSAFCPMIKAYWVQENGETIRNPYYGSAMPDLRRVSRPLLALKDWHASRVNQYQPNGLAVGSLAAETNARCAPILIPTLCGHEPLGSL